MRRTTRMTYVLALGLLAVGTSDVMAGWNNVFQTTCCGGRSTRSSFFAPQPAPACCPQTQVNYVQRSYYQPVTTYKMETVMEPVTSYRTSYYWEPVTSYRYTSYYDPCTGCAQQVATPYTSYKLRSQCNAVQSYVQRCKMVPVTEMRKSYYLEPVVSYSSPCCEPTAACNNCGPNGGPNGGPTPGVAESSDGAQRGGVDSREPPRIPKQAIEGSFPRTQPVAKPFRADRVASLTNEGRLQGLVVRDDRITPRPNAVIKFAGQGGAEILTKADYSGRFAVNLPAGEWSMFTPGADGKSAFHSTLLVKNTDNRNVTVVSR
jgi:hypothetical protein